MERSSTCFPARNHHKVIQFSSMIGVDYKAQEKQNKLQWNKVKSSTDTGTHLAYASLVWYASKQATEEACIESSWKRLKSYDDWTMIIFHYFSNLSNQNECTTKHFDIWCTKVRLLKFTKSLEYLNWKSVISSFTGKCFWIVLNKKIDACARNDCDQILKQWWAA